MNPNLKRNTNVEELPIEEPRNLPRRMTIESKEEKEWLMEVEVTDQETLKGDDGSNTLPPRPLSSLRPLPLFRQRSNSFRLSRPKMVKEEEEQQQQQQSSLLDRPGSSLGTLDFDLDIDIPLNPLPPIQLIDYSSRQKRKSAPAIAVARASCTSRHEEEKKSDHLDEGKSYHTRDELKMINSAHNKSSKSLMLSEDEEDSDEELAALVAPPPPPVPLQRQRSNSLPPMRKSLSSLLDDDDDDDDESLNPLDLSDMEDVEDNQGHHSSTSSGLVDYTLRCSRIGKQPQQQHRPLYKQRSNSFRFSSSKKSTTMTATATMETPSSITAKLGNSLGNLGLGFWEDNNDGDITTKSPIQFRVRKRSSMTNNSNNMNLPQLSSNTDKKDGHILWGSNSDHHNSGGSSYRQLMQMQIRGRSPAPTTTATMNATSTTATRASLSPQHKQQPPQSSTGPQRRRASMAGSLVPPPQYWVQNKLDFPAPPSSTDAPSSSSPPPISASAANTTTTTTTTTTTNNNNNNRSLNGATIAINNKPPPLPRPRRIQWNKSNSCSQLDIINSSDDDEDETDNSNNRKDIRRQRRRRRSSSRHNINTNRRNNNSFSHTTTTTTMMMDRSWNTKLCSNMDMSCSDHATSKDHSLKRATMASHAFITGSRIKRHTMSPARDI